MSHAIFLAYLFAGHTLTPMSVFVVFSYPKALGQFMKYLGRRLRPLFYCNVSVLRIRNFLTANEKRWRFQIRCYQENTDIKPTNAKPHRLDGLSNTNATVSLSKVDCKIDEKTLLKDISLQINKPRLVIVIGPVVRGKTSLRLAVLGELPICDGNILRRGKLAFVGQPPWVFSGTHRSCEN